MAHDAATRLAVYGTLSPGKVNAHVLADIRGIWREGTVRGQLFEIGWGAAQGFPGLVLDPSGQAVAVHLLESADLPAHWDRLDAFEGSNYRRVVATVSTDIGMLEASIYEVVR
ncbi:MAG: gamma-glutamylcyclotransferase [Pseudomonadota bacterium]